MCKKNLLHKVKIYSRGEKKYPFCVTHGLWVTSLITQLCALKTLFVKKLIKSAIRDVIFIFQDPLELIPFVLNYN